MSNRSRLLALSLSLLFLAAGTSPASADNPCQEEGTDPDTMYDLCRAAGNSHEDCELNTLIYVCNCYEGDFDPETETCDIIED